MTDKVDQPMTLDEDALRAIDDLLGAANAALHVLHMTAIRDGFDPYWTSGGGFETEKALRAAFEKVTPYFR